MTADKDQYSDQEPDIVALILQKVIAMAPDFSRALALQIEQEVKTEHGGKRMFVPKGAKRLTPEQRKAVFDDGLTNLDTDAIKKKHGISRATLYRVMKQGGGRFS
jgi:Mor family transcriptional regulator